MKIINHTLFILSLSLAISQQSAVYNFDIKRMKFHQPSWLQAILKYMKHAHGDSCKKEKKNVTHVTHFLLLLRSLKT